MRNVIGDIRCGVVGGVALLLCRCCDICKVRDLDNKSLYDICFLKTNQMSERDTPPNEHRAVRVASRAARRYASEL